MFSYPESLILPEATAIVLVVFALDFHNLDQVGRSGIFFLSLLLQ